MRIAFSVFLALLVSGLMVSAAHAQAACRGEDAPYRDFDFWVGEWSDLDAEGQPTGQTTVTQEGRGCVLMERWISLGGSTGVAMMFHDSVEQAWRRVWRSAGHQIELKGGLNSDGAMEMVGFAEHLASGERFPIKGLWTPSGDGAVSAELFQKDSEVEWVPWAGLRHVPRNKEDGAEEITE